MTAVAQPQSGQFDYKAKILLADFILFILLVKFLPFSPSENKGLALLFFVAVLWLTEALHTTITALLVPVLAVILGLMQTKAALSNFASPTIFLFFGGFGLAAALHIQGLDRIIANKIMALARGNFKLACIYLFGVTAFLSMWMSNTATAAMMLPLALGVLSSLEPEGDSNMRTYTFVLLGIAYSASIGGIGTLVGSPPNAIVASNLGLDFVSWLGYGLPIMIILLPLMIFTLFLWFKPKLDITFDTNFKAEKLNTQRKITLGIFVFIAFCWIFSRQLNPIISGIFGVNGKIASFDSVIALLAVILVGITRVANWKQISDSTDWGVLMLFGGGISLSAVLKSSGASKVMADGIVFMIQGGHFFLIGIIVTAFIIFLTEVSSNTASAALLVPIFISIAQSLGLPEAGLAVIIGVGASCAFMLPVATPPNAIVYGSGFIKQRDMVNVGFILNLVCIAVISIVGYFFWM